MWYSCGLIYDANIPEGALHTPVGLAEGVRLERLGAWVTSDEALRYESWTTREQIKKAIAAFVVEYDSPHVLDDKQKVAEEKIFLASLCLWIARPTGWGAAHFFHFQDKGDGGSSRRSGPMNRLLVTGDRFNDSPESDDLALAGRLLSAVYKLKRNGNVWGAIRFLSMAAIEKRWEPRYVLMWVVMEALFGPEDGREITYRISQRIALFNADAGKQAEMFQLAKEGYAMRSKVVHGGKLAGLTGPRSEQFMVQAEDLIRRALTRILQANDITAHFDGKKREQYLDELVFANR